MILMVVGVETNDDSRRFALHVVPSAADSPQY